LAWLLGSPERLWRWSRGRWWSAADSLKYLIMAHAGCERLAARLLEHRVVLVHGPITEDSAKLIIARMLFLEASDPSSPIELWIHSPGGLVTAGFAIADAMAEVRCAVHTYCLSNAGGVAGMLLVAGARGHRFIDPAAQVGLTDVVLKDGRPHETVEEMWELHRMRNLIAGQIAANAPQDAGAVLDAMRKDMRVSSRALLDCGMVDQVRASLPELEGW